MAAGQPIIWEEMFSFVKNVAEEMRKHSWKRCLLLSGLPQLCLGLTSVQFTQLVIPAFRREKWCLALHTLDTVYYKDEVLST